MKLLIITQKLDKEDDILGFFHDWVKKFAEKVEEVYVICLQRGAVDLPRNVKILSLGKENGESRIKYLSNFWRYIWDYRNCYDTVFVHMNTVYVLLGGFFWKLWGKNIKLWYAHGYVPLSLRVAEKLVDNIYTSTKSGCRLTSKKIKIVGQGIDTNLFQRLTPNISLLEKTVNLVTVGRIAPVKDYLTLIEAVDILVKEQIDIKVTLIGSAKLPADHIYLEKLKEAIQSRGLSNIFCWAGALGNRQLPAWLNKFDIFVNTSHTGSLDKAMVEAMACELPVISCNEAMLEVYGNLKELLMFPPGNPQQLADKIKNILDMPTSERKKLGTELREIVLNNHNLDNFLNKII